MTVSDLPGADRKRAALALLAVVVCLLVVAVALPIWLAHRHYAGVLEGTRDRLERYQRLAAAKPALEEKLSLVRAQGSERFFFKSATASLATAEIQDRVRQLLDGSGARVVSVQLGQPRDEGRFRQVSVTVQLNATMASLRRTLVALESSEPFLIIDSLTIRSQVPPGFRPAPGFDPELFMQIDVSGFAVGGQA